MKTHILFSLLAAFLLVQSAFLYSQNQTDFTKIVTGKTYKIVLFDDTEILGTVIAVDSANVSVRTHDNMTVIIPKNNILYFSTDLTSSKYKFSLSLLGGVSLLSGESDDYYFSSGRKVNPNINLSGIFFLSDTKAIKIDAGYTYVKAVFDYYSPYYNDPNYQDTYEGGNMSMFSVKGNMLFGDFSPSERFLFYGSVGLGVHLTSQQSIPRHYWSIRYPDTTLKQYVDIFPSHSDFNAVLSVGASFGYRISHNLGLKAEIEYNLVTGNYLLVFFGRNYFPVRAGIFYIL